MHVHLLPQFLASVAVAGSSRYRQCRTPLDLAPGKPCLCIAGPDQRHALGLSLAFFKLVVARSSLCHHSRKPPSVRPLLKKRTARQGDKKILYPK